MLPAGEPLSEVPAQIRVNLRDGSSVCLDPRHPIEERQLKALLLDPRVTGVQLVHDSRPFALCVRGRTPTPWWLYEPLTTRDGGRVGETITVGAGEWQARLSTDDRHPRVVRFELRHGGLRVAPR